MAIYLGTLILSVIMGIQLQHYAPAKVHSNRNFMKYGYMLLLSALLGGVVGYRKYVGTDYGTYIDIYTLSKKLTFTEIFSEAEPLYGALNRICADKFDDYVPMFAIIGIVTVALIVYGIYHSSCNYALSLFLFITGMYYFDLFNGMRQMIATAIMFAAYPLARRKRWLSLLVITVIAMGFHISAIIIFAVYLFAVYIKPGSKITWLTVAVFFGIYVFYNGFVNQLILILVDWQSKYSIYKEMLLQTNQGAHILRFAFTCLPVAVAIYARKVLKYQREDIGILLNISLINALFMLISVRHWIFARYCMFLGIFNIILWPELLKCFEVRSRRIVELCVICVYMLYFWLIVHTDSNLLPYSSWLFGGIYG